MFMSHDLQQATDAFELTSQRLRYRLRAILPAVCKGKERKLMS
jgi:hypothetical protein